MRLLSFLRQQFDHQPEGDVAADDWAPIPASATAAPESWGDWLSEEDAKPPPVNHLVPPKRAALGIELRGHIDSTVAKVERSPSNGNARGYEDALTPEERAIIEAQSRPAAKVEPKRVRTKRPSTYEQHLTPEERAIIARQQEMATEKRRTKKRSRRPDTAELIRDFGAHLTEEERQIIEEQVE